MEHLLAGRALMGATLGFHIIFALLGVGLPLCVSAMEYLSIRRRDAALRDAARLWSYIIALLVVSGVISGSVVALLMFLVWPGIMEFGGSAIGLAFMLEGYMFVIEASFLALYVTTWKRISGFRHWILSLPIVFGSFGSAVLITSVNGWMNHPEGIVVEGGRIVWSDPIGALATMTSFYEIAHSVTGYYLTASLLIAGLYAWTLLRKKASNLGDARLARFLATRFALLALVCAIASGILGDLSARHIASHEPAKFAAMELVMDTQAAAPVLIGGTAAEDGSIRGGMRIPGLLSWLAFGDTDREVMGLRDIPRELWPPLFIHALFDAKMAAVILLMAILGAFAYFSWKRHPARFSKPMLAALTLSPILSLAAIELGWMITEIGRQPYAIYGHMLTRDAYTADHDIIALIWIFPAALMLLGIITIIAARLLVRRFLREDASPY